MHFKDTIKKQKAKPQTERKYFQITMLTKELYPKHKRTFEIHQQEYNPILKCRKDLNIHFAKENIQMANKYI